MNDNDLMTDDAKLITALMRSGLAHTAWDVARVAGVDPEHAEHALARMADLDESGWPIDYPLVRRADLGPDVYGDRRFGSRGGRAVSATGHLQS